MDVDNGRLIAPSYPDFQSLTEDGDFEAVPEELAHAAKCKLNGELEAWVSLTPGGKLSKWSAQRRKEKRLIEKRQRASALKRDRKQRKHRRKKVQAAKRKNR